MTTIADRLYLLPRPERAIMLAWAHYGVPVATLGALAGLDRQKMLRRIERIADSLVRGDYLRCLRVQAFLSRHDLELAASYFRDGRTIAAIAAETGSNTTSIQRRIAAIRRLAGIAGYR
jgi:hypothetical protein